LACRLAPAQGSAAGLNAVEYGSGQAETHETPNSDDTPLAIADRACADIRRDNILPIGNCMRQQSGDQMDNTSERSRQTGDLNGLVQGHQVTVNVPNPPRPGGRSCAGPSLCGNQRPDQEGIAVGRREKQKLAGRYAGIGNLRKKELRLNARLPQLF
jgi:hypothetical protein